MCLSPPPLIVYGSKHVTHGPPPQTPLLALLRGMRTITLMRTRFFSFLGLLCGRGWKTTDCSNKMQSSPSSAVLFPAVPDPQLEPYCLSRPSARSRHHCFILMSIRPEESASGETCQQQDCFCKRGRCNTAAGMPSMLLLPPCKTPVLVCCCPRRTELLRVYNKREGGQQLRKSHYISWL